MARGRYASAIPLEHLLVSMRTGSVASKGEMEKGFRWISRVLEGKVGHEWWVLVAGNIGSCIIIYIYIIFLTHPWFLIIAKMTAGSGWKFIDDLFRQTWTSICVKPMGDDLERIGEHPWRPETDHTRIIRHPNTNFVLSGSALLTPDLVIDIPMTHRLRGPTATVDIF